jgi:hypothetical protein
LSPFSLVEVAAMSRTVGLSAALVLVLGVTLPAGETLPLSTSEPAVVAVAALVRQLDEPEFSERQAASQQLEEAGLAAIEHLEKTVTAGSREASGRALGILRRHFEAGEAELKQMAREALARLAENNDASTAQKARNVLNPPREPDLSTAVGMRAPFPPPPRILGGAIAFGGGRVQRISVSDFGGRKIVEVDDRDRQIKIESLPGGMFQAEVTDKVNPRAATRRIVARDLDDLKRRDAELGNLFEQYHGLPIGQRGAAVPFGRRAPDLPPLR